jgi:hypothetical protein
MVDWDAVLQDAALSPRGLLAELLTYADSIEDIVVVFTTPDGPNHERVNIWPSADGQSKTIALLEFAKWRQLQIMAEPD